MLADHFIYLAILGMGLSTYATRLAGYWLLQGRVITGRLKVAMEAVPPAILTAVIAPDVFLQGPAEKLAGALALIAAILRLPLLVVICFGVGSVAVFRHFL
jgi:uncharacterized membrane protein